MLLQDINIMCNEKRNVLYYRLNESLYKKKFKNSNKTVLYIVSNIPFNK